MCGCPRAEGEARRGHTMWQGAGIQSRRNDRFALEHILVGGKFRKKPRRCPSKICRAIPSQVQHRIDAQLVKMLVGAELKVTRSLEDG